MNLRLLFSLVLFGASNSVKSIADDVFRAGNSSEGSSGKKIAYLVPSFASSHLDYCSESHKYFQCMYTSFESIGVELRLFKDWHNPAILKDFVHERLAKAISKGILTDQDLIDKTRRAKILLHAAVPDQISSGIESGWRPDHRILAAQALAYTLIDHAAAGDEVTLVGLGIGGGQIVSGATKLLADNSLDRPVEVPISKHQSDSGFEEGRSFGAKLGEFARILDGVAPFFGPWAGFLKWGADGINFIARAKEILKDDAFLWQAALMPVDYYKRVLVRSSVKNYVNKLLTVATPVALEHFRPNLSVVDSYYNLYSKGDLKCQYWGQHLELAPDAKAANLIVKFDGKLLSPGHSKVISSLILATWLPAVHEYFDNPLEFKFGQTGMVVFYQDRKPFYIAQTKAEPFVEQRIESANFVSLESCDFDENVAITRSPNKENDQKDKSPWSGYKINIADTWEIDLNLDAVADFAWSIVTSAAVRLISEAVCRGSGQK